MPAWARPHPRSTASPSIQPSLPSTLATATATSSVFFLAHWCPHCRAEVPRPRLVAHRRVQAGQPRRVRGVHRVNRSPINFPPSKWLAREGLTVPVMTDDRESTAAQAWGLPGYPYAVLLRPDGTVAARVAGEFEGVPAFDVWVKLGMAIELR